MCKQAKNDQIHGWDVRDYKNIENIHNCWQNGEFPDLSKNFAK